MNNSAKHNNPYGVRNANGIDIKTVKMNQKQCETFPNVGKCGASVAAFGKIIILIRRRLAIGINHETVLILVIFIVVRWVWTLDILYRLKPDVCSILSGHSVAFFDIINHVLISRRPDKSRVKFKLTVKRTANV